MALGVKVGKANANNSAVPFAASGSGKIMMISTVGNAGTVYIGPAGVTATTGVPIKQDTVIDFGHFSAEEEDIDFSQWYVFSSTTDGVRFAYLDRG